MINNFVKIYGPVIRKEESKDKSNKNILSLLTELKEQFLDKGYIVENSNERAQDQNVREKLSPFQLYTVDLFEKYISFNHEEARNIEAEYRNLFLIEQEEAIKTK